MTQQPEDAPSSQKVNLATDVHELPTLFDIVLTGDQARELGITLTRQAGSGRRKRQPLDLDQRIQAAVDAALPKVTERTAATLRDALLKEVQDSLQEPEP